MHQKLHNQPLSFIFFLIIFLLLFVSIPMARKSFNFVQADTTTTPSTTLKNKWSDGAVNQYPNWVYQAIVGTTYSPAQYMALPNSQKQEIQNILHPGQQLPESAAQKLSKSVPATGATDSSVANALNGNAVTSLPSVLTAPRLMTRSLLSADGADDIETRSGLDIDMSNSVGTVDLSQLGFNNVPLTDLDANSFQIDSSSFYTTADCTLNYNLRYNSTTSSYDYYLTITLTDSGESKLTPAGNNLVVNIVNGGSTIAQLTINLWQSSISRPTGKLDVGNGFQLQYMFSVHYDGSPTDITHQTPNPSIDIPNFNMIDTNNSNRRVYSLYFDNPQDINTSSDINEFSGGSDSWLPTTSALLFGDSNAGTYSTSDSYIPNGYANAYPLYQFDQIKHVKLYQPDPDNPNLIRLEYDGYLDSMGDNNGDISHTNLVIHVVNTLEPNLNGDQMAMIQQLTNKTNSGTAANNNLTGLYYMRQYDTTMGYGNYENRRDDVPIRYSQDITTHGSPYAGKNEGLYFRSPDFTSPYAMDFSFDYPNAPDGWLGTHWQPYVGGQQTGFQRGSEYLINSTGYSQFMWNSSEALQAHQNDSEVPDFSENGFPIFSDPDDKGQNASLHPQDSIAFGNPSSQDAEAQGGIWDTAIDMKWSPKDVGSFLPNTTTQTLAFNGGISSEFAPEIRSNNAFLRIPQGTTTISIPGTATDTNSQYIYLYYTIDEPVNRSAPPADARLLNTINYGSTAVPHQSWKDFAGQITNSADIQKLSDGQPHTIYLYAYDSPDTDTSQPQYYQANQLISNIIQIPVNLKENITIHYLDATSGDKLVPDVVKTGYAGDSYNLTNYPQPGTPNYANYNQFDTTQTSNTSLNGHPPATIGSQYTLDTASLPTNGKGTIDQFPIDISYYYNNSGFASISQIPTTISFGTLSTTTPDGIYPIKQLTGDLTVQDTTNSHQFEVGATIIKPLTNNNDSSDVLTNALGYKTGSGTMVLGNALQNVYDHSASSPGGTLNVDVSDDWWNNGARLPANQVHGPVLLINNQNRSAIKPVNYSGEIDWSVTNGPS